MQILGYLLIKIISLLIIVLPLLTYAQQDTIKLPKAIAKKVVIDLISGDSAKAMLRQREEQLGYVELTSRLKDTVISSYKIKESLYKEILRNEESKFNIQKDYVIALEKSSKQLKTKLRLTQILGAVIIGAVTYLYIQK